MSLLLKNIERDKIAAMLPAIFPSRAVKVFTSIDHRLVDHVLKAAGSLDPLDQEIFIECAINGRSAPGVKETMGLSTIVEVRDSYAKVRRHLRAAIIEALKTAPKTKALMHRPSAPKPATAPKPAAAPASAPKSLTPPSPRAAGSPEIKKSPALAPDPNKIDDRYAIQLEQAGVWVAVAFSGSANQATKLATTAGPFRIIDTETGHVIKQSPAPAVV